jgi:hypothetical protein
MHNQLKRLDSRLRGNDGKLNIFTFYEFIHIDMDLSQD